MPTPLPPSSPPPTLDGAEVLDWAWSEELPFGFVPSTCGTTRIPIHGLALCRYPAGDRIYGFRCTRDWQVVQDSDYTDLAEAQREVPEQYRGAEIVWQKARS